MDLPGTTLPVLDLGAPAAEVARLVVGVRDDQLGRPTPCGFPLETLINHLLGLCVAFTDAASKVVGPTTMTAPDPAATALPQGWRHALPDHLTALAQAWRQPAAWTGTTHAGGVEMPAEVMGVVANDELVLHGWDLARSTGQDFAVAPANLAAAWQLVSDTLDDPAARAGLFGPVVPVDPDAPLLDHLLGGAGRDPRWSPPA